MLQRIPDELIKQVIRDTDIVKVISRYVKLSPAGRNYKGRCPFHTEKTASFNVDPVRKIFKCFGGGCGKSGNVIGFLMEIERFSFPEAFRFLASEAGIEFNQTVVVQTDEDKRKQGVFDANELAMNFFKKTLFF